MNQCERIARNMARRKAQAVYKNRHPCGIDAYVNAHYCDYLGAASQALAGHGGRDGRACRGLLHALKNLLADLTHAGQ